MGAAVEADVLLAEKRQEKGSGISIKGNESGFVL